MIVKRQTREQREVTSGGTAVRVRERRWSETRKQTQQRVSAGGEKNQRAKREKSQRRERRERASGFCFLLIFCGTKRNTGQRLSSYFVLLGLLVLGAKSVADGERGGCKRRFDSIGDGANNGVEAHRDQVPAGERRIPEMQEEGSKS
ncbi:hypothetical protein ACOSQ4_020457 [Xanthoceras sorbifolium]